MVGVYGVRGWIKVQPYTRPADNLLRYRRWWLTGDEPRCAEVVEAKMHGGGVVAAISGPDGQPIADRDEAAALIGRDIQVERSELPKPPKGSYYWFDLVGCRVVSTSGAALGVVTGLIDNGAQDVLVVDRQVDEEKQERMIPFVRGPIIQSVDLDAGLIVAEWEPDY